MSRRLLATLALAALLVLAGCTTATDIAENAATPPSAETADEPAASINYSVDYKCQDHATTSGDRVKACSVDFQVTESLPDGVEYVELHVSDTIDSETESYLITDVETLKYAYATDHNYGDVVIVEAQLSNGERVVLENHTLSCADVSYRNACDDGSDSE